jgi:predicted SAM-dependent methyltransferase
MPERKLHIGSTEAKSGWELWNIKPGSGTDHVGDAADLSRFENESFGIIYASHVLEHFDYTGRLQKTLKEWHRVLKSEGKLYLSVPDIETLCKLFVSKKFGFVDRFKILRMMIGGHCDANDYHLVGFDFEILQNFLKQAGFKRVEKIDRLGMFQDTSYMCVEGVLISLNVIAYKEWKEQDETILPLETSL